MVYCTCVMQMDVSRLFSLFSCVPTLSALTVCSPPPSVLTVLSCFLRLSPPSQHPLLFSPQRLSHPFYSFIVCLFSLLASASFSMGLPVSYGCSFIFLFAEFLWECGLWRDGGRGGANHHVLLLAARHFNFLSSSKRQACACCVCADCF